MGFPHQFIALVAAADIALTIGATLNLGILPVPKASAEWIERIAYATGVAKHVSVWQRVRGGSSAGMFEAAAQLTKHVSSPPRKLLLFILAVCLARCGTILAIWSAVVKAIASVRAGGPGTDVSGQAVGYSAVCVTSMLVNLSLLNALFQTRGLTAVGRPDTSIKGILTQYNASSLAAEQLLISALEWILFVLFLGTNKSAINPPRPRSTPSAIAPPTPNAIAAPEAQKKKDYGALSDAPQPLAATVPKSESKSNAAIAALPESEARSTDSAATNNDIPTATSSHITATTTSNKASAETDRNASTLAASTTGGLGTVPASGEATPTSEDIVDVSSDREQSKLDARDRLQRARENGKVRRRSLWKKIRGKGSNNGSESQN